jgi:hypothetical protein
MRRILLTSAIVALLSGVAGQAGALALSITNPGFESQVLVDGSYTFNASGWAVAGTSGALNPTTAQFPGQAPEGQNIGWSSAGSLSQTLSTLLAAN